MALARSDHTATKLPDGSVLVAGGQIDDGGQPRSLASAERYDPATGRWTPAGDMTVARSFATATLLRDGTVLVVGGDRDFGEGLASAEIYDPRTGEWTAAGDMSQARSAHAASLLGNGRVLVVGWGSRAAEVYNPLSRTWSATGSLNDDPGMEPVATVLTNGEVLVVGWNETETNGAQRFDPIAGTWARTPAIPSVPFDAGATAVRLSDGAVLVVGGSYGRSGPTDTVLLYMPETAH
jgi:N-acetylneuraminic acid mutarotase